MQKKRKSSVHIHSCSCSSIMTATPAMFVWGVWWFVWNCNFMSCSITISITMWLVELLFLLPRWHNNDHCVFSGGTFVPPANSMLILGTPCMLVVLWWWELRCFSRRWGEWRWELKQCIIYKTKNQLVSWTRLPKSECDSLSQIPYWETLVAFVQTGYSLKVRWSTLKLCCPYYMLQ